MRLFLNSYLAAPQPTLGHYRGDILTHPMLITAFYIFDSKVTGSLVTKVGSLSLTERLVGFKPGSFRFLLQRLNPLGHSPQRGDCLPQIPPWAWDFLNIFLRFLGFWGSFSYKNFSYKKRAFYINRKVWLFSTKELNFNSVLVSATLVLELRNEKLWRHNLWSGKT